MLLVVFELVHCGVAASSRNVAHLPLTRATVQHRECSIVKIALTLGPPPVPWADGRTALLHAGRCRRPSCFILLETMA